MVLSKEETALARAVAHLHFALSAQMLASGNWGVASLEVMSSKHQSACAVVNGLH